MNEECTIEYNLSPVEILHAHKRITLSCFSIDIVHCGYFLMVSSFLHNTEGVDCIII